MELDKAKEIWLHRNKDVKNLIIKSLEDQSIFGVPYSQRTYWLLWRKLIKEKEGIDCDPIQYMRAFSYSKFKYFWKKVKEI